MPENMIDVVLNILDEDMRLLAVVRNFSSLQWTPRYYEFGQFALQVGLQYAKLLAAARYVYRAGTDVLGVIDQFQLTDVNIMMRGRFAEALLLRTVINHRLEYTGGEEETTRITYTGSAEDVCRNLVNDYCIDNIEPERNLPRLELGSPSGVPSPEITIQPYGETVYDMIRETLTAYEMSFRIRYDFMTDKLYFEVYQGLDRTQGNPDGNEWCVFSKDFYNVTDETFTRTLDTRNVCYVVNGDEDNNEDETVTVITVDDGRPRAEVWVQDNTQLTADMTMREFRQSIRQTGLNKLAEYNIADTGECTIDGSIATPYGLGDRCTYVNSQTGIVFEQRITEVREVYEANNVSTTIVIGKDQLTEGKKIKRSISSGIPRIRTRAANGGS